MVPLYIYIYIVWWYLGDGVKMVEDERWIGHAHAQHHVLASGGKGCVRKGCVRDGGKG